MYANSKFCAQFGCQFYAVLCYRPSQSTKEVNWFDFLLAQGIERLHLCQCIF